MIRDARSNNLSLALGPCPCLNLTTWLPWLEGFPGGINGKEPACQFRRHRFNSCIGKITWRSTWQPTPVFLLGESHSQRSLVGYSPQGRKESAQLSNFTHSLAWNVPLVSLIFLTRPLVFPILLFSSLCVDHWGSLYISSCYSLELCIQIGISFLFSFAFHFSSFHSCL